MKVITLFKNNQNLIARAAINSREAQHEIYQMYAPKMLSVCRMYIKDEYRAEEAMLNAFFKVFTRIGDFKNEGSFEGWIRKIMVRESISYLRTGMQISFEDGLKDDTAVEMGQIHDNLDMAHIQQLIDSLPEGYKIVFVMYAIEGYKHQEIAKILQITEGTSKSQLFKARKILQEKISRDFGGKNISGYEK